MRYFSSSSASRSALSGPDLLWMVVRRFDKALVRVGLVGSEQLFRDRCGRGGRDVLGIARVSRNVHYRYTNDSLRTSSDTRSGQVGAGTRLAASASRQDGFRNRCESLAQAHLVRSSARPYDPPSDGIGLRHAHSIGASEPAPNSSGSERSSVATHSRLFAIEGWSLTSSPDTCPES